MPTRRRAQAQARAVDEDLSGLLLEGAQPAGDVPGCGAAFPKKTDSRPAAASGGLYAPPAPPAAPPAAVPPAATPAAEPTAEEAEEGKRKRGSTCDHGRVRPWGVIRLPTRT